jgi:hypothetical protein
MVTAVVGDLHHVYRSRAWERSRRRVARFANSEANLDLVPFHPLIPGTIYVAHATTSIRPSDTAPRDECIRNGSLDLCRRHGVRVAGVRLIHAGVDAPALVVVGRLFRSSFASYA